ncbi:HET domain containing protein [Colletotrichum incanum]|nr:HET domain containing protein [Colletotrichum incanum]
MWLINTTTLQLHENPPSAVYAILSHTWEAEELSFRDMEDLKKASKKRGFLKIAKICEIAKASGIQWAWVDTCCIDKSSSAELTESINSMWRWYKEARICYAFLSDLSMSGWTNDPPLQSRATGEGLERCRWFTRGWTLQELLAPDSIVFFDKNWTHCGPYRVSNVLGRLQTDHS